MNLYFRALKYIKPYLFRGACAAICTAIAAGGTAYLPWIIKDMVDQVLKRKRRSDAQLYRYQHHRSLCYPWYRLLWTKLSDELCWSTCHY